MTDDVKPRVGILDATLGPVTVAPVTPPDAYLGVARAYLRGADVLAGASPVPGMALTLLSAHILECLLKAFLFSKGISAKVLEKDQQVRHNLAELWRRSIALDLPLRPTASAWVERLSDLHGSPYNLRYAKGLNGLVLPGVEPMSGELHEVLEIVERAIRL